MKTKSEDIPAFDADLTMAEVATEEVGATDIPAAGVSGRARWRILAAAIVVFVVLAAGARLMFPRSPAAPTPASGSPSVADSLSPPPPLEIAIAGPAKGEAAIASDCQRVLGNVAVIAEALAPDFRSVGTASADAVALPEERQAGQVVLAPDYQRWEVRLAPGTNQETYARGLDHFGIELGVIGGAKEIVYLSKFSQPKPEQRTAPGRQDLRLYMIWQGGNNADQALALRAGLTLRDKVIAQFYPPEVEKQLGELERAYAEEHKHSAIEKTVFAIKAQGDGFMFYVMDQQSAKP